MRSTQVGVPGRGARLAQAHLPNHVPEAGDRVVVQRSGYELEAGARRLAISSADQSGAQWKGYEKGAARATPFGEETVVIDGNVVEQFLTVDGASGAQAMAVAARDRNPRPHIEA